jgi:hypothetical protein
VSKPTTFRPARFLSQAALQCCQAVVSLERQREGPVEATEDAAFNTCAPPSTYEHKFLATWSE